ncbi:Rv3654c family TadE-like protein, partial [Streptomyces mayteni]
MPSPADHRRPPARDRGSGTVFAACSVAVLCLVFGVVLALGQVMAARQRAATAADLAALAAAERALSGAEAACALADRVAEAQGARLTRCQLAGELTAGQ